MRTALALAPRLAAHRLRGTRGGATLDVLAVAAFTVSAFLTLTVVGGTWMFVQRWLNPADAVVRASDLDTPAAVAAFLQVYVVFAMVACALLVVPILNLGAGAARLGARGRGRRLASLRLLGMTSGQVVMLSAVETLVQAVIGTALGAVAWAASAPAWQAVSFQGRAIAWGELVPPAPVVAATMVVLLLLAVLSTVLGLQQVRISPLGVAAQSNPRALRAWRLGLFGVAVIGFAAFGRVFSGSIALVQLSVYGALAVMILVVVGAVNLVGPWVLQLLARPGVLTRSVPRLVAMRRILDDPRGAWRNVAGTALLGLVSAFVAIMPTDPEVLGTRGSTVILAGDLRTGALITLGLVLVVAAASTLVNQAALVFDRADEAIALDRAGFPRPVLAAVRRWHVLVPLVITLLGSVAVGFLLITPFVAVFAPSGSSAVLVGSVIVGGILLSLAAAEACRPLERHVLGHAVRRND